MSLPTRVMLDDARGVQLPEAMLDYECNLKGCCCRGWRIPFHPRDLVRLERALGDRDQEVGGIDGLIIVTEADHRTIDHIRLEGVGEDERCPFLIPDGACDLHQEHGVEVLPDLCVEFPAFCSTLGDRVEFHYEAMCPEVINALARSEQPYRLVSMERPLPPGLEDRIVRGAVAETLPRVFDRSVSWERLLALRGKILAACADESRPALEVLCALCTALERLERAENELESFSVSFDDLPVEAFVGFLYRAMTTHQVEIIRTQFWRCRRFMFDHIFQDGPEWLRLQDGLRNWQGPLEKWVEPEEAELRPLLIRFMAHRYFNAASMTDSDLRDELAAVPLVIALALRVTAAVSYCRSAPADEDALKLGLTTAEFTYRSAQFPASGFPRFSSSDLSPGSGAAKE